MLTFPFTFTRPRGVRPNQVSTAHGANALGLVRIDHPNGSHTMSLHYPMTDVEAYIEQGMWVIAGAAVPTVTTPATPQPNVPQPHTDLSGLKHAWKAAIHGDGGDCPVCNRFGKVYSRTINETMALSLKWLYAQAKESNDLRAWVNVPKTAPKAVLRSNQLSTLRWWGLIERMLPDEKDKKKKHSGMWRITARGMDFVEGAVRVPERVFTYDGEVVNSSSETVLFKDCKGGFDFQEVMTTTAHHIGNSLFPAAEQKAA